MKEKNFQSKFNRWLQNRYEGNGVFELKLVKRNSLPFDAVKEHQLHALQMAKYQSVVYKIEDGSFSQKPFDCFKITCPSFVVVMFYKRSQNCFYMIDIDKFLTEKVISKRKSLTEERAWDIGQCYTFGK